MKDVTLRRRTSPVTMFKYVFLHRDDEYRADELVFQAFKISFSELSRHKYIPLPLNAVKL